jgi:hypothetical protein
LSAGYTKKVKVRAGGRNRKEIGAWATVTGVRKENLTAKRERIKMAVVTQKIPSSELFGILCKSEPRRDRDENSI